MVKLTVSASLLLLQLSVLSRASIGGVRCRRGCGELVQGMAEVGAEYSNKRFPSSLSSFDSH